jgi:hypothetical protein
MKLARPMPGLPRRAAPPRRERNRAAIRAGNALHYSRPFPGNPGSVPPRGQHAGGPCQCRRRSPCIRRS